MGDSEGYTEGPRRDTQLAISLRTRKAGGASLSMEVVTAGVVQEEEEEWQ